MGFEFILSNITYIFTVCAIPVSLRFFRGRNWLRWGLLIAPLLGNALMYFWTYKQSFLYLGVIVLISMVFLHGSIRNNR